MLSLVDFFLNPLQDLLPSLNVVISTNESTQIYNRSCDLSSIYLQIPTENHQWGSIKVCSPIALTQQVYDMLIHLYIRCNKYICRCKCSPDNNTSYTIRIYIFFSLQVTEKISKWMWFNAINISFLFYS